MAGAGDEIAARAAGRGHLRASHADREQVIGILKAAFVQGMLAKDELDLRVGQTLASQTYADLAAVAADLPTGLAAAQPPTPVRAPGRRRVLRPGLALTVATVVYAAVWPVALALPDSGPDHDPHAGIALAESATLFYVIFLCLIAAVMIDSWERKRSVKQLPPGQASGAGGRASRRLPAADPGGRLPPASPGHRHTAEAAPSRRRRPQLPGWRAPVSLPGIR
jgi:hypothetical protein